MWEALPAQLVELRGALLGAVLLTMDVSASVHALLTKREPRSTISWVGLIWLAPGVGVFLYLLLGINRIERRARRLRGGMQRFAAASPSACGPDDPRVAGYQPLVALGDRVSGRPLVGGNRVSALLDGDEAYPAMLEAIGEAERSIAFQSYIFEDDALGARFVDALADAHDRGVSVRVLVDAAGIRFSPVSVVEKLRARGVPVARFLPGWLPWSAPYLNLRNHRKVLVVDGVLGFTGGMNITGASLLADAPDKPVRDLHFRVEGPVVSQLSEVFEEDWVFTVGEVLDGPVWDPAPPHRGDVLARGLADGPDEDLHRLPMMLQGALATARSRVVIVTPYFLPSAEVERALAVAALRGVRVDVLVPARADIPLTGWAMRAHIAELLGVGVRLWLTRAPFDHSKLMVVDDRWVFLGSGNWDERSLRLNFELNLECWSPALVASLEPFVDGRLAEAEQLTADDLSARTLPVRVRDGLAALLWPYL